MPYTTTTFQPAPGLLNAYGQESQALAAQAQKLQAGLVSGYQSLYDRGMAQADSFGRQQAQQVQNQYLQAAAQQNQGLISRGLGNSTVLNSVDTGLFQNRELNLTAAGEAAARQRLGVIEGLGLPMYGAQAQVGLAGLSAQQQLGQQYLALLGQMGTRTAYSSPDQFPLLPPQHDARPAPPQPPRGMGDATGGSAFTPYGFGQATGGSWSPDFNWSDSGAFGGGQVVEAPQGPEQLGQPQVSDYGLPGALGGLDFYGGGVADASGGGGGAQ